MGCSGCRKARNNRISRAKAAEKKTLAARIRDTAVHRGEKAKRKKIIEKKMKFCKHCPHSSPTLKERRERTRVCHKANISIQGILNNQKFKCPIGNF